MPLPGQFISCDWGTSSFRLRLIDTEGLRVTAEITGETGIRTIHDALPADADLNDRDAAFAGFLGERLDELLRGTPADCDARPVLLSGMATSTIGWRELSYASVPLDLDGSGVVHERIGFISPGGREFELFLVSGAATDTDVMRGEETELLGILNHPAFQRYVRASIVILPGTHSKHVSVSEGRVVDWRTFMTGEVFEALTSATILRQTTEAQDEAGVASIDDVGFREGVLRGFEHGMEAVLFQARTRAVLQGKTSASNRAFLSGTLIGSEMRHALGISGVAPLLGAGSGRLADCYRSAATICLDAAQAPLDLRAETVNVDLPDGAAIHGHAFLLKRWLGADDTDAR